MNDEIKFDLDKDIIMQIEMASYGEYNDTLAMMNDHLGEVYGYSNLKDVEEAQLHYEKELAYKAIKELQQENERLKQPQVFIDMQDMEERYGEELYKDYLKEQLEDYKSRCEKASEYNNQIIKDTKDFYRPTTDIIYSGDCLIDIAKNNINILQNGSDSQ